MENLCGGIYSRKTSYKSSYICSNYFYNLSFDILLSCSKLKPCIIIKYYIRSNRDNERDGASSSFFSQQLLEGSQPFANLSILGPVSS